jgi:hypothetical protein
MDKAAHPPPPVHIDRLSISGVDAATAKALGPAIEKALEEAALAGRLNSASQRSLRVHVKPGADERSIARALTRALGER